MTCNSARSARREVLRGLGACYDGERQALCSRQRPCARTISMRWWCGRAWGALHATGPAKNMLSTAQHAPHRAPALDQQERCGAAPALRVKPHEGTQPPPTTTLPRRPAGNPSACHQASPHKVVHINKAPWAQAARQRDMPAPACSLRHACPGTLHWAGSTRAAMWGAPQRRAAQAQRHARITPSRQAPGGRPAAARAATEAALQRPARPPGRSAAHPQAPARAAARAGRPHAARAPARAAAPGRTRRRPPPRRRPVRRPARRRPAARAMRARRRAAARRPRPAAGSPGRAGRRRPCAGQQP